MLQKEPKVRQGWRLAATSGELRAISLACRLCAGRRSIALLIPGLQPICPDTSDPESRLAVLEFPLRRQSDVGIHRAWPTQAWRGLCLRRWRHAAIRLRGSTIGAVRIPPG